MIRYTVFRTKWGYFGLAGTEKGLLRTHLPTAEPADIRHHLLKKLPHSQPDKALFKSIQKQIIDYFDGAGVNFNRSVPVLLEGLCPFAHSVLSACGTIRFGHTISYAQLARRSNLPTTYARAVGTVLAKNPLPLIIPCHRVIRSDGRLGGFSAPGGISLKKKLLRHESLTI